MRCGLPAESNSNTLALGEWLFAPLHELAVNSPVLALLSRHQQQLDEMYHDL